MQGRAAPAGYGGTGLGFPSGRRYVQRLTVRRPGYGRGAHVYLWRRAANALPARRAFAGASGACARAGLRRFGERGVPMSVHVRVKTGTWAALCCAARVLAWTVPNADFGELDEQGQPLGWRHGSHDGYRAVPE